LHLVLAQALYRLNLPFSLLNQNLFRLLQILDQFKKLPQGHYQVGHRRRPQEVYCQDLLLSFVQVVAQRMLQKGCFVLDVEQNFK